MNKEFTATFIGHRECYGIDDKRVRTIITELINRGVVDFLNGGMGNFDWMCARIVYELKREYPKINNHLVIPYLTFNIVEKKYFDTIIYPDGMERYHYKAAIPARNQFLVDKSAYAVCYVLHSWGGAAKTMQRALRQNITVINIGNEQSI